MVFMPYTPAPSVVRGPHTPQSCPHRQTRQTAEFPPPQQWPRTPTGSPVLVNQSPKVAHHQYEFPAWPAMSPVAAHPCLGENANMRAPWPNMSPSLPWGQPRRGLVLAPLSSAVDNVPRLCKEPSPLARTPLREEDHSFFGYMNSMFEAFASAR